MPHRCSLSDSHWAFNLVKDGGLSNPGWSSLIGIITAIVGNILISFALNTQRYAHVRLEQEHNERKRASSPDSSRFANGKTYGTIEQERIAEQRSQANAQAPGPGGPANGNLGATGDDEDQFNHMRESFQSDDTLRAEKDDEDGDGKKSYLKSKIWWLGIVMMTIGETGNFLAYGFAPASIVSPLGVVALVSNCLIAPLMLKERFRQRDFWGVLVAIAGAVTVVLSAKQSEKRMGPNELWNYYIKTWEFLVYLIATAVAIVALMIASPRYGKRTILIDLGLVGLFGGYTALSTKSVASLLSASLLDAFTFPIFYASVLILVASAVMQIRYLNKALQHFDSTQVIPTQFVLFTLSVIIGSAVLYRDFESTTVDRIIKFIIGCLLTFFGVYLITSNRKSQDDDIQDYDNEEETIQLIDEEANDVSERTPLQLQKKQGDRSSKRVSITPPQSPPRTPPDSAVMPSISVTPAEESILARNPWDSTQSVDYTPTNRPQTPLNRSQSEFDAPASGSGTPWFTPATSRKPMHRMPSSPADVNTPTKAKRHRSPPKPDPSVLPATPAEASTLRSARGSIHRLMPGPLMPPLSSSLSGIIADSLLKGEGSPSSIRARLRRNRSDRRGAERRRSIQAGDEEATLENELRRHTTHESALVPGSISADDVNKVVEEETDPAKRKSRLRSMSETLSSVLGKTGKRGKERADEGGGSNETLNG